MSMQRVLTYRVFGNTWQPEGTPVGEPFDPNSDPSLVAYTLGYHKRGTAWIPDGSTVDAPGSATPAAAPTVVGYNIGYVQTFGAPAGSFDPQYNNSDLILLPSAARTANTNTPDQTNYNWRGMVILFNVSNVVATGSVIPTIQGKDSISGNYYPILTGPTITAAGLYAMTVQPGIVESAGFKAAAPVPRTFRVSVAHGNAVAVTYSIGAAMVV